MAQSAHKGRRGERELCRKLREHGFGAIRSAQVAGAKNYDESADIITSIDPIRFEVKRGYEDVSITSDQFDEWRRKACMETHVNDYPVLAWRKNRQPWMFFFLSRGEYCKATMVVGVEGFVDSFFLILPKLPEEYEVDDPQSWRTTNKFS